MSRKIAALVYEKRTGSAVRKAVLAYLAELASDNGKGVWASKATIAAETECSRSTVIKTMNDFVDEGILVIVGTRKCQNGATIEYDLDVSKIAALPNAKSCHQSESRTSPYMDGSATDTPPVREPDVLPSASRTQTVLEPSLNQEEPLIVSPAQKKPRRRSCELPEGWVPSERNLSDARKKHLTEQEISHEADQFANHHRSKGTQFVDWDAAWRTWVGNVSKYRGRGGMAGAPFPSGYGQGGSIASIVARRRAEGTV